MLQQAERYAYDHVLAKARNYSVVDVLLQTGEEGLIRKLSEAAARAYSLIHFSPQLASERRETYLLSAYWPKDNEEQRRVLLKAIDQVFGPGRCALVNSRDPSEIVIFYYVDGLPMSAVSDLTGRCLDAFLKGSRARYRQIQLNNQSVQSQALYRQRGVPVYSSKDAEERVWRTGVVHRLYSIRGPQVGDYAAEDIPELNESPETLVAITTNHFDVNEKNVLIERENIRSHAIASEDITIGESGRDQYIRIADVKQFLDRAGFDCKPESNLPSDFLASARLPIWRERFPKGLYVQSLFGVPIDKARVEEIYRKAKEEHCDHALVIIDRQPDLSGLMQIATLRVVEEEGFILMPIDEASIKEGLALNEEKQNLQSYVNKYLGKGFDPYDVRGPVTDAMSFFGRESLTDELLRMLRLGQNLGLFGFQKMGKSSVLKRIQRKAEFPVAYVYLKKGDSLESIYQRILREWFQDMRIKNQGTSWNAAPDLSVTIDPKAVFEQATRQLLERLKNSSGTPMLAIFFDEIEKIMPEEGDKAALKSYILLMDLLRGLQQETKALSLMVAGVDPRVARRNYLWGDQKNPMYQVISEQFLLPLSSEDCTLMICSLGQQVNLKYDVEAIKVILELSGSHPFIARQICSNAYKKLGSVEKISLDLIQRVALDFVNDTKMTSYFDERGLWAELGQPAIWGKDIAYANHKILNALAHDLHELAESELCSGLDAHIAKRALNDLKERGLINKSDAGRYTIPFGLFSDWIREHKPFAE